MNGYHITSFGIIFFAAVILVDKRSSAPSLMLLPMSMLMLLVDRWCCSVLSLLGLSAATRVLDDHFVDASIRRRVWLLICCHNLPFSSHVDRLWYFTHAARFQCTGTDYLHVDTMQRQTQNCLVRTKFTDGVTEILRALCPVLSIKSLTLIFTVQLNSITPSWVLKRPLPPMLRSGS